MWQASIDSIGCNINGNTHKMTYFCNHFLKAKWQWFHWTGQIWNDGASRWICLETPNTAWITIHWHFGGHCDEIKLWRGTKIILSISASHQRWWAAKMAGTDTGTVHSQWSCMLTSIFDCQHKKGLKGRHHGAWCLLMSKAHAHGAMIWCPWLRGCPHFGTASRWGVIVWQFYLWHVWSVTIRHVILYVTHSNVTFDSVNDICDMRYVTTGCHCQGNVVTWWSVATIVDNVTWSWWPHGHMAWPLTSGIVLPLYSSWETRTIETGNPENNFCWTNVNIFYPKLEFMEHCVALTDIHHVI